MLSPDGSPRDVREYYHPGWVSHGVVASTASDVVRFFDALFRGALLSRESIAQMLALIALDVELANGEAEKRRHGRPSYGLGLMGDPASPWGSIAGHNGGGPCYSASAFHAFDLGGMSVCVLGAIEDDFDAERVAFELLDAQRSSPSVSHSRAEFRQRDKVGHPERDTRRTDQ